MPPKELFFWNLTRSKHSYYKPSNLNFLPGIHATCMPNYPPFPSAQSEHLHCYTFCVASNGAERLVASCMKLCCGKCLSISLFSYTCVSRDALDPQKKQQKLAGLPRLDPKHPMAPWPFICFPQCTTYQFSRFEVIPLCTTHRDLRRRNYPVTALTAWNRSQRNHKWQIGDLR